MRKMKNSFLVACIELQVPTYALFVKKPLRNESAVFIDLRKAFDTVDHHLLCKKLEFYDIRGVAYQWIRI